jgi:hypothetical protein
VTGISAAAPVDPLRPDAAPLAILLDYDGTVAQTDVGDMVMAEHVTAEWEPIVAACDEGRIGSRRTMEAELGPLRATEAELMATAAAQPHDPGHDPGLDPLVRRARAAGIPVEIVSDGFGLYIPAALVALGLGGLPVLAASTTFAGDRARIEFPNGHPACLVWHAQAAAGPRTSGCRPGGRLCWRRRERPLRGRPRGCGLREALPRPDLRRGGLAVPAVDGAQRDRCLAVEDPRGVASRSGDASPARAAAVLLRP